MRSDELRILPVVSIPRLSIRLVEQSVGSRHVVPLTTIVGNCVTAVGALARLRMNAVLVAPRTVSGLSADKIASRFIRVKAAVCVFITTMGTRAERVGA